MNFEEIREESLTNECMCLESLRVMKRELRELNDIESAPVRCRVVAAGFI